MQMFFEKHIHGQNRQFAPLFAKQQIDAIEAKTKPRSAQFINTFTLLAATALAVSNLLVGMLQNNTFLIMASAIISALFAGVYAFRTGMIPGVAKTKTKRPAQVPTRSIAQRQSKRFPLWLFLFVLFVLMPTALLFLQSFET